MSSPRKSLKRRLTSAQKEQRERKISQRKHGRHLIVVQDKDRMPSFPALKWGIKEWLKS